MKRLMLPAVAALAVLTVSCGNNGSSNTTPPPPTGNFSNASLKGTYAFSMSGTGATVNDVGAFIARVGSFVADGNGNISMGMEDISDGGILNTVQFTGGTYSIQANGKGTLTLNTLSGGLGLTIALNSSSRGVMIQTDLNATSSGSFILQSPSAFTATAINGPYVFDVSGADINRAPVSVVGQIMTNGTGGITGGIYDSNDGSSNPPLITAQTFGAGGTYVFDPTNGGTFGRGTFTFASRTFAFYIVDSTRIRLIETEGQLFTLGDAVQQSGAPTQTTAGSFAFLIGGSGVLGTGGPIARGGRFTTDASGNLTNIQLDDNNNGSRLSIGSGTTIQNAKFAMDTINAGTGRGTLTFTAAGSPNAGTFTFVFYLSSATQAFIQDTSNGVIGDGSMLAQTSTFSAANVAGNYVFDWSGINLSLGFEEDFAGQYALGSSGAISGVVDFVELASPSKRNPAFLAIPISGTLTINGDGTGANNYTVTTGNSPSATLNYHAYLGGSNTMLLVGVDSNRTIAGSASVQP
jgi:hypothetical protein